MQENKIYKNIAERYFEQGTANFDSAKPAFRFKKEGSWQEINHKDLFDSVSALAVSFVELGIHKGDRVGIISENRIEWIISSLALTSIGAVDVPLFPILTSKQIEDIFTDCSACAVIVSNNFQLSKILDFKSKLDCMRQIIIMNEDFDSKDLFIHTFTELVERGKRIRNFEQRCKLLKNESMKIEGNDLLTVIYTSGTTGSPKGVMLTHDNLNSNINGAMKVIPDLAQHESLMYLPICHAYERCAGFYTMFFGGTIISIAESIESVPSNINEIKPTIITTVPKLLDTVRKKIYSSMEKEGSLKKSIFNKAIKTGIKLSRLRNRGKSSLILNAEYKLAEKLVFSKIRENLGSRIKMFFSGGAPLSIETAEFFEAIGIAVLQGYGLTEASPIVAANTLHDNEHGTIGKPLFNVQVKIAEDGEILVKGPNVMKGYWGDTIATENAIDPDGWLYTGDIGSYTERGNIIITDRKKNLFVSSGGKNIAPQPIENMISQSRYVDICLLIGDNREFVTALISPNFDQLKNYAANLNLKYENMNELISHPKITELFKEEIDYYQKDFSKYEKVRKFRLLSEPFSIQSDELSPKMSIKRHIVERKYSDLIETMYK